MKPLEQLNNVERARLLHNLFPTEVPALLQYVKSMCEVISEEEEMNRRNWKEDNIITYDFWLSLAADIKKRIEHYGVKLEQNSRQFSDQLFDGYNAIYMAHCLYQYTKQRKHTNEKFSIAVELLFAYS